MKKKYKYLFGPVPSRRFGLSLGVDLTPFKTCSFDCVFCQLGQTTSKVIQRKAYVPTDEVIHELHQWSKQDEHIDYVTLAGSGEPTLHSEFGDILQYIREFLKFPSVLLTNSSLLSLPAVQRAALFADVVKVSLSVWDDESYARINRPHENLKFQSLVEGLITFRSLYDKEMRMEVFIMDALNSDVKDVEKIAEIANKIHPDYVELNTAVRPVESDIVKPVSSEKLADLTRLFTSKASVICPYENKGKKKIQFNEATLIEMLKRRPCTLKQLTELSKMHPNELSKYLGKLIGNRQLQTVLIDDEKYYKVCE